MSQNTCMSCGRFMPLKGQCLCKFVGRRDERSANTRKTRPVTRTHTGIGRCENPRAEVGVPEVASSPNDKLTDAGPETI